MNNMMLIMHMLTFLSTYCILFLFDMMIMNTLCMDLTWMVIMLFLFMNMNKNYMFMSFLLLIFFFYYINLNTMNFNFKYLLFIIIMQKLIMHTMTYSTYMLVFTMGVELFTILVFILFIHIKNNFKMIILWTFYMWNLLLLMSMLLFMYNTFLTSIFYLHQLLLLTDYDVKNMLNLMFSLLLISKIYSMLLLPMLDAMYTKLPSIMYMYLLTFYILFIMWLLLLFMFLILYYMLFMMMIMLQNMVATMYGLQMNFFGSLLLLLSFNNNATIFLLLIMQKTIIMYMFMIMHMMYSMMLFMYHKFYFFYILTNIYDAIINENFFLMAFMFFSYWNSLINNMILALLIMSMGAMPFMLNFYTKVFYLMMTLTKVTLIIFYFLMMTFIIIYMYYMKMLVTMYNFNYQMNNYFLVKHNNIFIENIMLYMFITYMFTLDIFFFLML